MAEQSSSPLPLPAPAVLLTGVATNLAVTVLLGKLTERPLRNAADRFDDKGGNFVRGTKSKPLNPVMGVLSASAEPWTLYPLSALVAARWVADDRAEDAATLGMALLGSAALSRLVKQAVKRPRPRFQIHQTHASGSSFPSQHIAMSVATYGTIAYLAGRRRKKDGERPHRLRFWAPVVALCALIGWSRVYQGVHHPTDVLGGLVAGTLWLTTCGVVCNCLPQASESPATSDDGPALC